MSPGTSQETFDTPFRMLAVDDEPGIRNALSLYLGKSGFEVTCAENTRDALAIMEERQFDVVVTDIMMPGECGLHLLDRIRERYRDLPVILMTGYAQMPMVVEAIKNGAFDFITKPCDFEYLKKTAVKAATYARLLAMRENYRAELEATVARRTEELEESRRALKAEAQRKDQFLVSVTHEMRTPLNGLTGALDLMVDAGVDGRAREYLALARQSAQLLAEQFSHLVSLYRGTDPAALPPGAPQHTQGES